MQFQIKIKNNVQNCIWLSLFFRTELNITTFKIITFQFFISNRGYNSYTTNNNIYNYANNRYVTFEIFPTYKQILFSYHQSKMKTVGLLLDDRLKEKFMKPQKGVLCFHFLICLSVCLSVYFRLWMGYRSHLLTQEPNCWVTEFLGYENNFCFFVSYFYFYLHFPIVFLI